MLSEDIRNLARTFEDLGARGFDIQISAGYADRIAGVLAKMAGEAEAMENLVIPLGGQVNGATLPPGVIRLAGKLHEKGVRVGMPVRPGRGRS